MIALARFILRGQSQAALVVATTALLAIILMPFSWLSAGALTLVVLHLGKEAAFRIIAIAGLATIVMGWILLGTPTVAFINILFLWLPTGLIAYTLRQTVSLALSVQILTLFGLGAVLVMYLMFPAMGETWSKAFLELLKPAIEQSGAQIEQAHLDNLMYWFARAVPGLLAVVMVFNVLMGLFIGRWWQAALFNPKGFSREFNELRLGKVFASVTALLLIANAFVDNDWVLGSMLMMVALTLVQGTAVMHGVIDRKQLSRSWLFGFYVLLILIPQVTVILAIVGLLDAWVDIRKQIPPNAA